ncbi:MAG: asparagine synthetase B, partial [Deltaproteobacteria bacterium]|nr:asparagine synthetase B [Deltaproteobacteria bacterium]
PELVRTELGRAVESRMVSDVPLGALLSGGIDSSIIVALMSRSAGRAGGVKTFTAGFNEADFDERPAARALAEHYKTEHTELLVRPDPAGIVDRIVNMYDEPFADSSAMPTWLICRAAREHVTVALTGDGGDEAFGGYDRYRAVQIASRLGPVGYMFARLAGNIIKPFAPKRERSTMARFVRFTDSLPYPQSEQYFMHRMLFSHDELEILFSCDISEEYDLKEPNEWFCGLYEQSDYENEFSYAQMHDISTYLPDDLLVKTDIASMSSSLELRSPMLSPTVIELGLSLPCDKKAGFRRGKLILREAFKGIIPDDILKKTKRGFGVPISKWLRDELRNEMCDVLLDESF